MIRADIRNWIRNIEQHASDNVNKILVGNKADMDESKRVSEEICLDPFEIFFSSEVTVELAILTGRTNVTRSGTS